MNAQVNCSCSGQEVWRLQCHEELSQARIDKEHNGNGAVDGEGHEQEQDDAEPSMIWEYMR